MIKLHSQTLRTFFHSVVGAIVVAPALVAAGHPTWAAGFAIGAFTSLFSLFSLKVCIPALFYKGATARATALLQVVLIMKLPIYAIGLYFATRMGNSAAFAAFVGCTTVPAVITLETVGRALLQSNPRWKRAFAMRASIAVLPATADRARSAANASPLTVDAPVAVQVRPIQEGAA